MHAIGCNIKPLHFTNHKVPNTEFIRFVKILHLINKMINFAKFEPANFFVVYSRYCVLGYIYIYIGNKKTLPFKHSRLIRSLLFARLVSKYPTREKAALEPLIKATPDVRTHPIYISIKATPDVSRGRYNYNAGIFGGNIGT